MPWRTIGQNWPDNKELSLKFRVKLTLAPVSHWLCAVPQARKCQEEEGKESGKNGPVPPLSRLPKAGRLLRSEGAASSASRTGHRNWTQRKLNPNPSFTVSSGALKKSVMLGVISFSSRGFKVDDL